MNRKIHVIAFIIGIILLGYSVISAVVFHNPHFYTFFALGSWLTLDYIDYKLNSRSIFSYFISSAHHDAFLLFFITATIACFVVDYIFGVNIAKMWIWRDYQTHDFVFMFLFMNAGYVLSMYELYKIIHSFLRKRVSEKYLINSHVRYSKRAAEIVLIIGGLCLVAPFFQVLLGIKDYIEFIMILPFTGVILITDAITYLYRGKPSIFEILRFNLCFVLSFLITVFIATFVTEMINLPASEWQYIRMPFPSLQVLTIPLAVFIGWVPLVFSTISMVNMVKRIDLVKDREDGK